MRARQTLVNTVKGGAFRGGLGAEYTNLWWMLRARSRSPWVDWNFEKKAVFIHVPKNAGTSLYSILGIQQPPETHCTAYGYRSSNRAAWEQSFTFAFSRNPWDRFVSAFHYLKYKPISQDDKRWADEMLGAFETFADFAAALDSTVFRSAVFMWRHFSPQWYFLSDLSGRIMVDHVARFENLADEAGLIGQRLGVAVKDRRFNVAERDHYSTYYNDRLRAIVADAYARDIELFDYSFETPGETIAARS